MPEADKEGERYQAGTPQAAPGFFLKGCHQLDWGMKNRLARTFNPQSGRTVMLAIDHGYFQGPTSGLERIDLSILPKLANRHGLITGATGTGKTVSLQVIAERMSGIGVAWRAMLPLRAGA